MRKTVTALFCDVVGSTAFGERVDAESSREAMARYFTMSRAVVEDHGGIVAKFIGDGVMALFGVPEVAEDDAERAVRAGLALQAGFGEISEHIASRYGVEVGLRVGLNTGEVVIDDADDDVVGDALNTAARLEAACTPGRVLVGQSTWRLTRSSIDYADRGEIQAKGKDDPVASYEVVQAHEEEDELATPFVGREDELGQLRAVLEDSILNRHARLVTVVGSPGVGKTRLAREMQATAETEAVPFELRCERSGTATFAPIADLLRSVAGITDAHTLDEMLERVRSVVADLDDAERVADLLAGFVGAGPMRSTEEMFFGVRRLFEVLGASQPVVLVVDDIQWAEPLFLDLLEHLAEWVRTVPLLIVGLARPEIREVRPVLAEAGRRVAAVVQLEGLTVEATGELAARLIGADTLPPDLLAKIPESTEGNPLFVRELMRMLVDDGVISDQSGSWELTIDVDAVEVPPTINSLLASRVERMSPEERRVLELAAVVGSEFPIGAVQAAGPEHSRSELESTFERLRRKELIEPTGSYWGDEPVFRFHHVLIRDAAYRRLLKGARVELHTLVGDWTQRTAASLVGEHEVAIANHFEQAHLLRRQLDLDDNETRALGDRAAALFHTAAARALEREDLAAAGSLASRALGCVDDTTPDIAELLLLGCEALLGTGNVAEGAPLVDRLAEVAADDPRLCAWVTCFRTELVVFTDPTGLQAAERAVDDAASQLEDLGDQAGVAKARLQRAAALARLGRIGECETQLDLGLSAARAVDDRRRVTAVLGAAPVAALWGPSPVPRAGGRCLDVVRLLRITTGSPAVEATSIRCQAVLEALRGRYDTARTMLGTARTTLEELGLGHGLLETELYAGLVELLADDPAAAEPFLRRAHDGLGRLGIGADVGQAAAHLARSLLLQGRLDEAEELAAESDALAGQNPQTAIISRSVQAEVLSARAKHAEAVALAEEAVQLAAGTDILVDHANAVTTLARVRGAAGDDHGAASAATEAAALYEQKGATVEVRIAGAAAGIAGSMPKLSESAPHVDAEGFWNEAHKRALDAVSTLARADQQAWSELLHQEVVVDDRRALVRLRLEGKESVLASAFGPESTDRGDWVVKSFDPIAVRGDDLALVSLELHRHQEAASLRWLGMTQWTDAGLMCLSVLFDPDDLQDAIVELERVHHAGLAPCDAAIVAAHAGFDAAIGAKDIDTLLACMHPAVEIVDHRRLAWPSGGLELMEERALSLFDAVESVVSVTERFLRLTPGCSAYSQSFRTVMSEGASLVEAHIIVRTLDASGLVTRVEQFAESDTAAATARFDEVVAAIPTIEQSRAVHVGGVVNLIVRAQQTSEYLAPLIDGVVVEDAAGAVTSTDTALASLQAVGFGGTDRRVVAVRGDHLALIDVGIEDGTRRLSVEEIDEHDRLIRVSQFDVDAAADALDYLRERWSELDDSLPRALQESRWRFSQAIRDRDVDALASQLRDDFQFVDHRPLGAPAFDKAGWLSFFATVEESNAMVVTKVINETSEHGYVNTGSLWIDGERPGEIEMSPKVSLIVFEDGLVTRLEFFPEDELDVALAELRALDAPENWETTDMAAANARFDQLVAGQSSPKQPPSGADPHNAATKVILAGVAALNRGDLEGFGELLRPDIDYRNHAEFSDPDGSTPELLDNMLSTGDEQWVRESSTVAVAGDRFAVVRLRGVEPQSGFFNEWAASIEVDEQGLGVANYSWTPADLRFALADCRRRHLESDHTLSEVVRRWSEADVAMNEHSLARVDSLIDEAFVFIDQRPHSILVPMDKKSWVALQATTFSDHPAIAQWMQLVDVSGRAVVSRIARWSDPTVAEADWELLQVWLWGPGGLERFEVFDLDQGVEARARFEELAKLGGNEPRPRANDRLQNACTRAGDRHLQLMLGGGDSTTRPDGLFSADFVSDDRRSTVNGGVTRGEAAIAASRVVFADIASLDAIRARTLAIRGDRLALVHVVFDVMDFVLEIVAVESIDEQGRRDRTVIFDADVLADAFAELDRLYLEGEAAPFADILSPVLGLPEALNRGDLAAIAALIPEDFKMIDHRPMGWPEMDRQAFIDLLKAHHDLDRGIVGASEVNRVDARGLVATNFSFVQSAADLAESTWDYVTLYYVGPQGPRLEYYPVDQLHTAIARFDELEALDAEPLVARAERFVADRNAAGTCVRRLAEILAAGGLDRLGEVIEVDIRVDDYRSTVSFDGFVGIEGVAQAVRATLDTGIGVPDPSAGEVYAARGEDHVLTGSTLWGTGGQEIPRVLVVSLGATGRIGQYAIFDVDDLVAAYEELDKAYLASLEPERAAKYEEQLRATEAIVGGDVDPLRELYASDFVANDRRLLGAGIAIDLERYLALVADRPATLGTGSFRIHDHRFAGADVSLMETAVRTTSPDHGVEAYEKTWSVVQWRDQQVVRHDIYGADQHDEALADAQVLAAESSEASVRQNSAVWCGRRLIRIVMDGELDRLGEVLETGVRVEDHRGTVSFGVVEGVTAYANAAIATAEVGLQIHETAFLAVRGEHHAMARTSLVGSGGEEIEQLVVASLGATGRIREYSLFDGDALLEAEAELDRSWLAMLSEDDADLVRRVRDCGQAILFGDVERVAQHLTADFRANDIRLLSYGEIDRDTFLSFVAERPATIGQGHMFLRDFVLRGDRVHLYVFESRTTSEDFGVEAESVGIGVGRVSQDGSGRFDAFDVFDEDQIEVALVRADELAASG